MKPGIWLGIDGGGSKTAGILLDPSGRALARLRLAGSPIELAKPSGKIPASSLRVLKSLLAGLLSKARLKRQDITMTGLGMSGADYEDQIPKQRRALAIALGLPLKKTILVNDSVAALWGAAPEEALVMVQAGTAFTAAWRRSYGREELFDNLAAGAPFDIRFELPPLVARMIDGRFPASPLMSRALQHYGFSKERFARAVYEKWIPSKKLLTTPPLVFRAWARGDKAGTALVKKAAEDYALAAVTMAKKTGSRAPVIAFGGGVISRGGPAFVRLISRAIHVRLPKARVSAPRLAPEYGAAMLAAFTSGMKPEIYFKEVHKHATA